MPKEGSVRLPAEWEPHAATCLSWPNPDGCSFPGDAVGKAIPAMRAIVRELARGEAVFINCRDGAEESEARLEMEADTESKVRFTRVVTNEPWCRDHGPVIVEGERGLLATCWRFSAWGGKYEPYDADAKAAAAMASELAIGSVVYDEVLEGGMIDSNGDGVALVSERALLDQRRNKGLTRENAEVLLAERLGIERVIWLDANVPGDDTDGHVDTFARFVSADRIVVSLAPGGPEFQRVVKRIGDACPTVDIVAVPPPQPFEVEGDLVPASYANFYIGNSAVLLPVFNRDTDDPAAAIFESLFPDRKVVAIDCSELIWGLGAIHCLTCPVPGGVGR